MVKNRDQRITFLVYSKYGPSDIRDKIGVAEYSYYFVLKTFVPLLSQLGNVKCVSAQDDLLSCIADMERKQESYIFFSFTPPHSMPTHNGCSPVPVFAWEYNTLPSEDWDGKGSGEWLAALKSAGCAITHSSYSKSVVKKSLGTTYPVFKIPSPVWDGFKKARAASFLSIPYKRFSLTFTGVLLDSFAIDFVLQDEVFWQKYSNDDKVALEQSRKRGDVCQVAMPGSSQTITVSGVVYTSIFNPFDGRKNWESMLTAFCYAHRENRRATLIMKISANHYAAFTDAVVDTLRKLAPIKCRVIVIYGFLEEEEYEKLLKGTSFYVNTSFGEGQCIPLMEFLSAGVPAISPGVTAMADYIRRWHSLVVKTHIEPTHWQHDPREKYRCMHYRVDWQSLRKAYRTSYWLAMPLGLPLYKVMQIMAMFKLSRHCSFKACTKELRKLVSFLQSNQSKEKSL